MLVRSLIAQVLLNTAASGADGVTSVENVDDNVGRVDNLVQFVPDTLALALVKDGLNGHGEATILLVAGLAAEKLGLLETLLVRVHALFGAVGKVIEVGNVQLDSLSLRFGTKDTRKGRRLQRHLGPVLLQAVGVLAVADERHGQLVGLEQDLVGVLGLFLHGLAKGREGILGHDTRVGKPLAVRLDDGGGHIAGLPGGSLCDLTISVSLGLSLLVHVQELDPLRIAIRPKMLVLGYSAKGLFWQSLTDRSFHPWYGRWPCHRRSYPGEHAG